MPLSAPASAALLATLRGARAPEEPGRELRARAADGDASAREELAVREAAIGGAALAIRALARDRAAVTLDDGSVLSLHEAQRLLARKEEHRAHRPLRRAIDGALVSVRHFYDDRYDGPAGDADAFLRGSDDLARAALATLQALAGGELVDEHDLARALDLPLECWTVDGALAVVSALRGAARAALRSVRVPSALHGWVVLVEGPRLGVGASPARFDSFAALVRGGCRAVGAAVGTAGAEGHALGALSPAVLRAVGLSRADAERTARLAACARLLAARITAARLLWPWSEALERAVPLRVRPSPALRELLDVRAVGGDAASAVEELDAAAVAVAMREAYDEAFALQPEAWRGEGPGPGRDRLAGWLAWVGPWL